MSAHEETVGDAGERVRKCRVRISAIPTGGGAANASSVRALLGRPGVDPEAGCNQNNDRSAHGRLVFRRCMEVAPDIIVEQWGGLVTSVFRYSRYGTPNKSAAVAMPLALVLVGTVYAQDRDDSTLHEAASRGERATVLRLLDRGADIDEREGRGRTPLHLAARSCFDVGEPICRGVVAVLLDRGADVDARDAAGRTPLHRAAGGHMPGVVVELMRRGADIQARDDEGWTPLHVAAQYGTFGAREVAVELLQRGADVDAGDADGTTPLQVAEARGRTKLVTLLRRWHGAGIETTQGRAAGVRVEVTASSVIRSSGPMEIALPDPEDLVYVEAVLLGPFFERGRNEELTIRMVPDLRWGLHTNNWSWWWRDLGVWGDPWGALQRFAYGTIEFHRGARLLARVRIHKDWTQMDGVSYSPQTGLLNLHLSHVNVGSGESAYQVVRYDSMTGRLEVLDFLSDAARFEERLMTCTGEQQRWPAAPSIGRTVFFQPCRSNVERVRALYAAAGDVRAWGSGVVARAIATEPGTTIDVACDACAEIDDTTLSARLTRLRRSADLVEPDSVSIERFASPAFELVVVGYRATGDPERPFTLLFVRPLEGPWQPIYGWERAPYFYPFGHVDGFVPGADALVRLSVEFRNFLPREAFLDLDARTLRVAMAP